MEFIINILNLVGVFKVKKLNLQILHHFSYRISSFQQRFTLPLITIFQIFFSSFKRTVYSFIPATFRPFDLTRSATVKYPFQLEPILTTQRNPFYSVIHFPFPNFCPFIKKLPSFLTSLNSMLLTRFKSTMQLINSCPFIFYLSHSASLQKYSNIIPM